MSEETRVSKIRSLQTSDTGIIRNECEIKKIWKTCIKNNKMRNDQAYQKKNQILQEENLVIQNYKSNEWV